MTTSKEFCLSDVSRILQDVVYAATDGDWDRVELKGYDLMVLARAAKRGEPVDDGGAKTANQPKMLSPTLCARV